MTLYPAGVTTADIDRAFGCADEVERWCPSCRCRRVGFLWPGGVFECSVCEEETEQGPDPDRAWNESASSDDEARWTLYRSVNVELDDDGVRLSATDSARLWTWWVEQWKSDATEPAYAEGAQGENVTLSDSDWRARDLMRWVVKRTKKQDDRPLTVTVTFGQRARDDGQLIGTEQPIATIAVTDTLTGDLHESVVLVVIESAYPELRVMFRDRAAAPVERVAFDPILLTKMVKALPVATDTPVTFEFSGETGSVAIRLSGTDGGNPLRGLLMPMRLDRS